MKLQATLAAAALMLAPALHAFTLDFASYVPSTIPANLNVAVPGYGNVIIYAGKDATNTITPLEVGTLLGAAAIQFTPGDVLYVQFAGAVSDFSFATIGVDAGEALTITASSAGQDRYQLTYSGPIGSSAGITGISATPSAVPEPTSALLGLVGAAGLVSRRRR